MPDHMSERGVPALLSRLVSEGHIEDRAAVEAFLLKRQGEAEAPLYIRILTGIGAALAAVFFIAFLYGTGVIEFDNASSLVPTGLVLIAAAVGLHRLSGTGESVTGSFLLQMSFAAMASGKFLAVIGFDAFHHSPMSVPLAILVVSTATYHLYPLSLDRFLSSFMFLLSILVNVVFGDETTMPREPLFNGFFVLQLAGAAVLLTHRRIRREYVPVAQALALSLCASVLYPSAYQATGYSPPYFAIDPFFVNALLAGGLVALFAWAGGGVAALKRQPMIVASLGAVLLGAVSALGVLLSIGLMVLGYARQEKFLLVLGALLMPAYLWLYYYNLDVSLLTKSLMLTGGGVILLAGRFYMAKMVQSREA